MPPRIIKRELRALAPRDVAELNIERKKLSDLKPHPRNPRKHPKPGSAEWEVLKKSLEHDYFDPLVWNSRNGLLVSGHLRRKVMTQMGIKSADVVVVDYDENTHLARLLAANKGIGEDDQGPLSHILGELGAIEDFDLSLTGYSELPEDEESGLFNVGLSALPDMPSGERSEYQHSKFVFHDSQRLEVEAAVKLAKELGLGESTVNEHPSSNAIAAICKHYNQTNKRIKRVT